MSVWVNATCDDLEGDDIQQVKLLDDAFDTLDYALWGCETTGG